MFYLELLITCAFKSPMDVYSISMNANRKRKYGQEGYTLVSCQSLLALINPPHTPAWFQDEKDCRQSRPQGAEIQA